MIVDLARITSTDVRLDVSDQEGDDIQNLIDDVISLSQQGGVRLRGIRVGGDILNKLGGATVFMNARYAGPGTTLVVAVASDIGDIEFAFGQ
ncbi:hypothetical protein ATN79_00690 [Paraburkholderia caribensis]|nr:hypothetical protein ATN79_00690 [Paraburkholderia caribensis]